MKNWATPVPIGCGPSTLMSLKKPAFASISVPFSSIAAATTASNGSSSDANHGTGCPNRYQLIGVKNRRLRISTVRIRAHHAGQSVEAIDGEPADDHGRPRTVGALVQLRDDVLDDLQLLRKGHRQPQEIGFPLRHLPDER